MNIMNKLLIRKDSAPRAAAFVKVPEHPVDGWREDHKNECESMACVSGTHIYQLEQRLGGAAAVSSPDNEALMA